MATEKFYLNHNNTSNFQLKADGVVYPLDSITKITFTLGDILIESTNLNTDSIKWCKSGYASGEVRISISGEPVLAGKYEDAYLVLYSTDYPAGYVWGNIVSEVIAEVEGG